MITLKQRIENAIKENDLETVKELVKQFDVTRDLVKLGLKFHETKMTEFLMGSYLRDNTLDELLSKNVTETAIEKRDVDLFLKYGYQENVLKSALNHHAFEIAKQAILGGANIHESDDRFLRHAASNGHLEMVEFAVEQGAYVRIRDDNALRYAAASGYVDIVNYLIEAGCDPSVRSYTPLREAIRCGYRKVAKALLLAKDVDENLQQDFAEDIMRMDWVEEFELLANLEDASNERLKELLVRALSLEVRRISLLIASKVGKLDKEDAVFELIANMEDNGYGNNDLNNQVIELISK